MTASVGVKITPGVWKGWPRPVSSDPRALFAGEPNRCRCQYRVNRSCFEGAGASALVDFANDCCSGSIVFPGAEEGFGLGGLGRDWLKMLKFIAQNATNDILDEGFEVAEAEEAKEVAGGSVHGAGWFWGKG